MPHLRLNTLIPLPGPLPEGEGDLGNIAYLMPLPGPLPEGEGDLGTMDYLMPLPGPLPEGEGDLANNTIGPLTRLLTRPQTFQSPSLVFPSIMIKGRKKKKDPKRALYFNRQ